MRYCIYLRKSRADSEAEMRGEGETLSRHEKALTELANKLSFPVDAIYREVVSGDTIAARPEMQKLLAEVSNGLWEGVIVMDIDRLARGNSIDQGIITQTFRFSSTKIVTPTKIYDPNNEFDEEYFEFGLFMSRREYNIIKRRMQRGRIASVKEGKYVGNKPPYGYERVKIPNDKGFTLRPIPEQAVIVRNIYEWYAHGKKQENGATKKMGIALIARELNEQHIKSYTDGIWTRGTIKDMLQNITYIGKLRWNWRPSKKKISDGIVKVERPRSNDCLVCDGLHEPIISEKLFYEVQRIFDFKEKKPVQKSNKVQNPLASLIVCGKCGRKLQRHIEHTVPDIIRCTEPTCDNYGAYMHLVEKAIIKSLKKWSNPKLPKKQNFLSNTSVDYTQEMTLLEKSEAQINSQLDRAYNAFETGIYDTDTFMCRSQNLKTQLLEVAEKKRQLQCIIDNEVINQKIINEFIPQVEYIIDVYDTLSEAEDKNEMLRSIIDHIDYIKEIKGKGLEEAFTLTLYPKLPKL